MKKFLLGLVILGLLATPALAMDCGQVMSGSYGNGSFVLKNFKASWGPDWNGTVDLYTIYGNLIASELPATCTDNEDGVVTIAGVLCLANEDGSLTCLMENIEGKVATKFGNAVILDDHKLPTLTLGRPIDE